MGLGWVVRTTYWKEPMTTPVAGIGASAGGLEAFKLLPTHLPPATGLAFVFIQHLDPKHHSNLAEILAKGSPIPVQQASDGMEIEPNRLYVVPPGAGLEIAGPALRMTQRAAVDASIRDGVMRAGFDDFAFKPFRQTEIFLCMARHLGVRYSSSEWVGNKSYLQAEGRSA